MQVLKQEIHDSILKQAENLFYDSGYEGASIRELAKRAGISTSNLYRYFESKSRLFEALMDTYSSQLTRSLSLFLQHDEDDVAGGEHVETLVEVLCRLIQSNRKKFLILMEGSQGTRFEQVARQMIKTIETRIHDSTSGRLAQYPAVVNIIARNFFKGVLHIVRSSTGEEELRDNLNILVEYHLSGIEKLAQR